MSVLVLILVFVEFAWAIQQPEAPAIAEQNTTETKFGKVTKGRFRVFENRLLKKGRQIHLNFVVLHAQGDDPKTDPFFFIVGGPGQAATTTEARWANHWIRRERDVVLIDQRGTGGDNRLQFEFKTEGNTLQQFMDSLWRDEVVKANLDRLSKSYDLSMYSTQMAADDLNDFRKAMGYSKINISGGSYGTRASLVYIRRHGETVRTATLAGCAPIEFRNPLYHAEGGQRCLDMIFEEVAKAPKYREAFGDLRKKFAELSNRLEAKPVSVLITNRTTGKEEAITLDRDQFMSAVRFQTYYTSNSRRLPKLLCEAHEGNFRPFVLDVLRQNIAIRQSLAMGMLLSVSTAEDLSRIDPAEVEPLTKDTYLGPSRVLSQMRAGKIWPKSELDGDYGEPVKSDVQTLILSGSLDPVTPPKWGEMVHKNFPNSIHVVVPTAHDVGGRCVDSLKKRFLETGDVGQLDTRCAEKMELPPLVMPEG